MSFCEPSLLVSRWFNGPRDFSSGKGYRKGLPRKFPSTFFYRCENGLVTVYQIFPCSEDSQKWTKGL